MKVETKTFVYTRIFNLYIHNTHTNGMKKTEFTKISEQIEIYTFCSMNKKGVKRVLKWERKLGEMKGINHVAFPFPGTI